MRRRSIVALAAAGVLAGCIPFPYGAYYRPAYPDPSAVVTQASCGGQAGPPARLAFKAPPGLDVRASALKPPLERRDDWPLAVSIAIPPGHTLHFAADSLRVAASPHEPGREVVPEVRVATFYRLAPDAWIDAAALAPVDPAVRRTTTRPVATARLGFGRIDLFGDVIEVALPAIETDAGRVVVPPLRLEADTVRRGIRTFRTREHLQSVADREAACRRDTPTQRCEYIRQFDPDSFRVGAGDFELKGRFWAMETSRGVEPLQFELEVAASDARRWLFAETALRVRTPDAAWREHRFADVAVGFTASVPLSAAMRSATAGRATETSVHVDASLGTEERPRYFVRFPPYRFDGVLHEMKPIELELRRFDGGLEPFNC